MKTDSDDLALDLSPDLGGHDNNAALSANRFDLLAASARSILGAAPWVGPAIAELIGYVIPNQRVDRIARFVAALAQRLDDIERTRLVQAQEDPEFVDLMEDGLLHAARALTQERLEHIADLIKNSLSSEQAQYVRDKHLLSLLGEINDVELLLLKFHSILYREQAQEFWTSHQAVLNVPAATFGSSQEELDRHTLFESFRQHLARLGLLSPKFRKAKKGELPEFDESTGTMKASGYEVTPLGRLLLRQIDMIADEPTN